MNPPTKHFYRSKVALSNPTAILQESGHTNELIEALREATAHALSRLHLASCIGGPQ